MPLCATRGQRVVGGLVAIAILLIVLLVALSLGGRASDAGGDGGDHGAQEENTLGVKWVRSWRGSDWKEEFVSDFRGAGCVPSSDGRYSVPDPALWRAEVRGGQGAQAMPDVDTRAMGNSQVEWAVSDPRYAHCVEERGERFLGLSAGCRAGREADCVQVTCSQQLRPAYEVVKGPDGRASLKHMGSEMRSICNAHEPDKRGSLQAGAVQSDFVLCRGLDQGPCTVAGRLRVVNGWATWPAFWLQGEHAGGAWPAEGPTWPDNGEIDVMEIMTHGDGGLTDGANVYFKSHPYEFHNSGKTTFHKSLKDLPNKGKGWLTYVVRIERGARRGAPSGVKVLFWVSASEDVRSIVKAKPLAEYPRDLATQEELAQFDATFAGAGMQAILNVAMGGNGGGEGLRGVNIRTDGLRAQAPSAMLAPSGVRKDERHLPVDSKGRKWNNFGCEALCLWRDAPFWQFYHCDKTDGFSVPVRPDDTFGACGSIAVRSFLSSPGGAVPPPTCCARPDVRSAGHLRQWSETF